MTQVHPFFKEPKSRDEARLVHHSKTKLVEKTRFAKKNSSDFVVVLLGKDTLKSAMTLQEITWAKQAGKVIIRFGTMVFNTRRVIGI
ncbi:MAG: hypothetical protein U0670_10395 [Anaerolineae bacterium]